MEFSKKRILKVILILAILGMSGSLSCKKNLVALPGQEVKVDSISFQVWDQQTIPEKPPINVTSIEMTFIGKETESIELKKIFIKLTKTDNKEEVSESPSGQTIEMKSGIKLSRLVRVKESSLSKLTIQVEDTKGKTYGPIVYDFHRKLDRGTEEVRNKKYITNSILGFLYNVQMSEHPDPGKVFYVLSFKGKGVLEVDRDNFKIKDEDTGNTYEWIKWIYNSDMAYMPGTIAGVEYPIKGTVVLFGSWDFSIVYELPLGIKNIKFDFPK